MEFEDLTEKIIGAAYNVSAVDKIHKQQLSNYLKACGKQVGLLINFGTPKITINRIINNLKNYPFNPCSSVCIRVES